MLTANHCRPCAGTKKERVHRSWARYGAQQLDYKYVLLWEEINSFYSTYEGVKIKSSVEGSGIHLDGIMTMLQSSDELVLRTVETHGKLDELEVRLVFHSAKLRRWWRSERGRSPVVDEMDVTTN